MGKQHRTHAYRIARAARINQARTRDDPCALHGQHPDCPGHIDYTLRYPHPWSVTTEHTVPVHQGGDHTTLDVAHLACQHHQGGTIRAGHGPVVASYTSGVWD